MASETLRRLAAGLLAAVVFAVCAAPARAALPRPAHVVVVIDENQAFWQVIGSRYAPWLNAIAKTGAIFTDSHGVTHPSQPNYLALFAGVTNTNGDDCPAAGFSHAAPNIASELLAAHLTFRAYSENLPYAGFAKCWYGDGYGQKHAPWTQFTNVPPALHRPYAELRSYDALPTLAFIIPNMTDDMHDAPVKTGDDWARAHLTSLVAWARTHDTLIVFTCDEGYDRANSLPTFFVGPMVRAGRYAERIDHYRVLRTLEAMYGLPPSGKAAQVAPIVDVWR
jgi:acid phosphatase